MSLDILIYILITFYVYVPMLWPLCFGWLLVLSLHKQDDFQVFKNVSFLTKQPFWVDDSIEKSLKK